MSKAAHPEPSARMDTEKMRGQVDSANSVTPDDDVLCEHGGSPGDDDKEPGMSAGVGNIDPALNNKGTNSKNVVSLDIVKGGRDETVLPSVEMKGDDVCVYKRGFCQLHKAQGERFVETTKRWRDKGRGKGFGFITSKLVKYRCRGEETIPGRQKSDT